MQLEILIAGTLSERLPDPSWVKELTLSGEINGSDVTLLRSLCGCEGSKACVHMPILEVLDLSDVRIVPGGFAEDARAVTGVDEIGNYMFSQSRTLKAVLLPRRLVRIGSRAFFGCRELLEVRAGDCLSEIGEMAFMNCASLESLVLGTSPLRVGRFAFGNCRRLALITVMAAVPPVADSTSFSLGCRVLVPDDSLGAYKADAYWGKFELVTEKTLATEPEIESVQEQIPKPKVEEPRVREELEEQDDDTIPATEPLRNQELASMVAAIKETALKKETMPDAWVETMVVQDRFSSTNGESAALLVSGTISNLKDVPVRVEARLFREDGRPLADTNQEYCLADGQVGMETTLYPKFDRSQFSRIVFSLPYTEFHLGGKQETLEWQIIFFADGKQIGEIKRCSYTWTGISCARITAFRLESGSGASGAYVDGVISFKLNNCAGKAGNCVLFLFYEDGKPVKDRNGSFCSVDGQVCSSTAFSSKYASALFSDFRLRLPLSEFHLDGVKAKLKLLVQVFVENRALATSVPIIINWNH